VGARDSHRHPDKTFGAFYEDLLLEDQSFPEGTIPQLKDSRALWLVKRAVPLSRPFGILVRYGIMPSLYRVPWFIYW
jgi:hypothetical protein